MKVYFGDLPTDAQAILAAGTRVDFSLSDFKAPRWFSAWARDDVGAIIGIFAVEFKYPWEGYVNVLVLDQACMSRKVLRAIFTAAFTQARRLTAEVAPDNRRALRQVQRLGFVYEGFRRMGRSDGSDVLTYGMLRGDCKFLPGYKGPTVIANPVFDAATYERVH